MKKFFSFFAMVALMGMMVACGDAVGKDGKTSKNEIKEGDAVAVKIAKMSDQMAKIMEQEPSVEAMECLMRLEREMMNLDVTGINPDDVTKALKDIDPKYADENAYMETAQANQEKWMKWIGEHQEEVQKIAEKNNE